MTRHPRASALVTEIRTEMLRKQVTSAALVGAADIKQASLSRKLNGHVPLTVDELERICAALDTSPATLWRRVEEQRAEAAS